MLILIEIPIDSYYGEYVYSKRIYLEADSCPSKTQVISILQEESEKEKAYAEKFPEQGPHCLEISQALESLLLLKDSLPHVYQGGLIQSNVFIDHPKWGKQSITVSIINPIKCNL